MRRTITRIGAVGAGALLALGLIVAGPPAGASDGHSAKAAKAAEAEKADRATCLTTDGHTQGRSQSDPDGMSNGGFDKPGCTGGFDDDRDGNNGCGNDADREDDNNGRCGPGENPDQARGDVDVSRNVDVDDDDNGARCKVAGKAAKDAGGCVDTEVAADGTDATVQAASTGTTDTGTLAADTSVSGSSPTGTDVAANGAVAGDSAAAPAGTAATDIPTEVLGETLERSPSTLARTGAGIGSLALLGGLLCGGGRLALVARRFLRIG